MNHRRTSSLSEEFSENCSSIRRPVPRKAASVDTGTCELSESNSAPVRRKKSLRYASAALVRIGSKGDEFIQRFDEKCDDIESGPIAQSAKATVQKAADVIDECVLKHVKLPQEVQELLYEIERTQAYQSARGKFQQAYTYVEPIISRVNSVENDNDGIDFVIPPTAANPKSDGDERRRDYARNIHKNVDTDGYLLDINPQASHFFTDNIPQIKINDENDTTLQTTCRKESGSEQETGSIASVAESEKLYEIIRKNKFYKTMPMPKPVSKKRSVVAQISKEKTGISIADNYQSNIENNDSGVNCNCEVICSEEKLLRNSTKYKELGKNISNELSIEKIGSEINENDPLIPTLSKVKGISEDLLREQLRGKSQSIVCFNGKTYIINQDNDDKKENIATGGATAFFENATGFVWESVADVGTTVQKNEDPNWMEKIFNGIESFITNAHDPWLSEADKDPLACECCGWLSKLCGGGPNKIKRGNCITRNINKETFCVVSKRFRKNYVHRFSASKSLFCFSPWNPLRRAAIYISTNQYFDYFVMGTILLNCGFLAMTKTINEAEYIFLAIYTAEMSIKTVAKGFILNKYTYLRNPWNWLDFVVIASGYVTLIIEIGKFNVELGNLAGLRTFRVLRALKTVSIMPGLKTIINALLNSIKQLVEVMTLTVFCLMVFALFALQVYMGVLKNKCVLRMGPENFTDEQFSRWLNDSSNWFYENGTDHPNFDDPVLCGNQTGARSCPFDYTCLPDVGGNPNFGYTSFDNFLWSMLTTFQLITLDYWEDVYNKIIATGGPIQVVFFSIVVFFGSFYLINLMLAVVAMSYEEEAENTEEEKTKEFTDNRDDSTFSFDPDKLTHAKPLNKKGRQKERRVIVMRKGAGILSDSFANKRKRDSILSIRTNESTKSSRLQSAKSSARPSSLVVSPPSIIAATPSTPEKGIHFSSNAPPHEQRKPGDGSCDPCTVTSSKCCQCQCHTRSHEGVRSKQCDDPRPYLHLADNPADRQPSLDDSGVVGDHEGDDVITTTQISSEKSPARYDIGLYAKRKCNGVSPSSPAALSVSSQHIVVYDDDDMVDRNCEKCRDCCMHYSSWLKFQGYLYLIVHAACFDLFIMLCIILNTVFLAVEHHGMSYTLDKVLEVGNRVFTVVFTLECIMKIMALSKDFFVNRWNVFDLIIVLASLLDLGLEIGSGLSVLRGMRLLRVLKLAQSWRTMRVLLSIIISTLGALGNLTFVLIIIIYIFAVIGMQLFGKNYVAKNFEPETVPRWNFTDFFHSFMMIFRILCGEWVEPLWDCMRAAGKEGAETCLAIFLPALVMGNFMILNLFLALLLNSFNSEELKSRQDDLDDESRVIALLVSIKNFLLPKALVRLCTFEDLPRKEDEHADSTNDDRIMTIEGNTQGSPTERAIKQSFSEPEIHIASQEDNDSDRKKPLDINPENQGYERMSPQTRVTNVRENPINEKCLPKDKALTDSDRYGELLSNYSAKLLIKRRVEMNKGEDDQPSGIIELSEYKRRQLPEIGIVKRPPALLNPIIPDHILQNRNIRQPSTIERESVTYNRDYAQKPMLRTQAYDYNSQYYRSHSPFYTLSFPHTSSNYMRHRYITSLFGPRINSDPSLDTPGEFVNQDSRSVYNRSHSPINVNPQTSQHRFFPSAPPHATSPDYRMRRSYRGEYTPIYARTYCDKDDNLDYKVHPRYTDMWQAKSSEDHNRSYGPRPLDYREQENSFYNRNIRDAFHREYDFRHDTQLRDCRFGIYDKFGSFYKSESDFFPRDYIGEYRNEYNASKIGYSENTDDTYFRMSAMPDLYEYQNKYKIRNDDASHILPQIPNDYNTSYMPTPVTSKSNYPLSEYPCRNYNYSPEQTDSFPKYSKFNYSSSEKSQSENRKHLSRDINEDSISDVNYSEGYLPKLKINRIAFDENYQGSGEDLSELALDTEIKCYSPNGKECPISQDDKMMDVKVTPPKKQPSWGAVIDYVDEITTGVKDDDDPRFQRIQKKKKEPPNCFPDGIYLRSPCCQKFTKTKCYDQWYKLRKMCLLVCESTYFEYFILSLIFASSITLCFEDIHLDSNPNLKDRRAILNYLNLSFAAIFTIEMLLKWVAIGFVKYYTSVWSILDCFIVLVSLCSLFVEQDNLIALRSLRTLRALRPLRAISRWQGMKIVVNALMYAIPSIFNVLLVCLVFWLIFSIMGVQMFGGKFYKCVDSFTGEILPTEVVNNKSQCEQNSNFSWVNSKINFDHVGYAYLALFQVATFEGWMEVMNDAVDCRGLDLQPEREANIYAYIYFVIFIVCGSFFTLNLFIGVIIDNFNMLKKKYEGGVLEMFLTDSQKNYYTAMKKLGRKKPQKVIRRPKHPYHAIFYDIAVSRRFEISIFVLIFLNMVTMAIEHHHQSRTVTFTLEVCNALFTTIFGMEAIVKIIGLRHHYFTVPWNLFDFILVFASIMGILLKDVLTNFPISPTLLRVVRVFRIGRILRLIKAAKGIRKLLFALIVSLPALFNIGALLFLITFIYAIIGMAVFGHVQRRGPLDELVNFETFGSSMMLLFRLITSAGWNDVLDPLMVQPPNCDPNYNNQPNGNCGHPIIAIGFFVSFIIINFMIVINMYIAVILENFNQAHKEEEIGIVEDDLEMFYVRWAKYDPHATQFITFPQLSDFIASLDVPFGIPKPNTVALVSFDLPIAKDDKIHCLDILHALTKHVLGHVEETEDFKRFPPQLKMQMEDKFKKQFPTRKELEIVSSTRRWKKMDTAAKVIQRTWKLYKRCKRDLDRKNLLLEEAHTQTSSPGGSSIKSGFRKVSNLLQIVPMPMSISRRRSVTVLEVDKEDGKSRRGSKISCGKSQSPRSSFFFPLSRRASRASISSLISNSSQISVQVHHAIETTDRSKNDSFQKGNAS